MCARLRGFRDFDRERIESIPFPRIDAIRPEFQAVPCNPGLVDLRGSRQHVRVVSLVRRRLLLATWVCAASASVTSCILDFDGLSGVDKLVEDGGDHDAKDDVSLDAPNDAANDASDAGCVTGLCLLCKSTCEGGTCKPTELESFLGQPSSSPFTLATSGGVLYAADLNGNRIVDVGADTEFTTQGPRVLGATDGSLFWFNEQKGLLTCTLPCSGESTFVPAGDSEYVFKMVHDARDVFWIPGPGFAGASVQRCPAGGCGEKPAKLATLQDNPNCIALDDDFVYWSLPGLGGADGSIRRVPKLGSDAGTNDYVSGLTKPGALAVSGGVLYYTRDDPVGKVFSCPIGATGCAPATQVSPNIQPGNGILNPRSLVVDATRAYWTNDEGSSLMGCPNEGCDSLGDLIEIPTGIHPGGLLDGGSCLFWTERDSNDPPTTRVMTVAKPGN